MNWRSSIRDGTVLPYPRSVHVRPDTLDLIPALGFLADRPRLTLGGGSEWALTPAELRDRWGGTPPATGPLAAILLLDGVPGTSTPALTSVSPAIASLELARSSWAASVDFGGTLARLATAASTRARAPDCEAVRWSRPSTSSRTGWPAPASPSRAIR